MNETEKVAAAQALCRVQDEVEGVAFFERQALLARVRVAFSKFEALKKAGFTADEALRIVNASPF